MKRFFAFVIALALLLALPLASSEAAEVGELLIASEKVSGAVGDVVKVNFELYPNLPDGRKLDSLSGSMKYNPEIVTLGAISQVDEENNLTSLMKGKASSFQYNIDDSGELRFAFIDAYGVEADGFWFQAEFRIEQEGATDFVFNGITYTGLDADYKTESFYIDPVSVGGIFTEGQEVPSDGAAEETFAPLTPAVNTPAPVTPTPKPSHNSQTVPVTSSLPTYSAKPTASGVVTPGPAVTSMPMTTPAPQESTPAPVETEPPAAAEDPERSEQPNPDAEQPVAVAEATEIPVLEDTPAPVQAVEEPAGSEPAKENQAPAAQANQPNMALVIGVIIGIVAVVGLGALAIVLILKRRRMDD